MILNKSGRAAGEAVAEKVRSILERVTSCPDFGNGRFVRTLIEKATVKQAVRLMRMEGDAVSKKDAITLLAEDFNQPSLIGSTQHRTIGF
jgi:hypothetical protein